MFAVHPEVDWRELFENANPVELEVGSGKGAFLIASARARPETNFFGIENQPRWARIVREQIDRFELRNARVLTTDASVVISRFLRDDSVRAVHLYFPDPWWKRRHQRRRLVRRELGAHLFRILEPGGTLWLATDVENRFQAMLDELSSTAFEISRGERTPGRPNTNFESKYRQQGRPLYYAALHKRPTALQPPASGGKMLNS